MIDFRIQCGLASSKESKMIEPYTAVGLIPKSRAIKTRDDIAANLDHVCNVARFAHSMAGLFIPVRLIAIPEGALQSFVDEITDMNHADYAHNCALEIPGKETTVLSNLARELDVFVMAQAKAKHPDWPDLFFNTALFFDPEGNIVLKHYKISTLLPWERSVSPHDLFDWWIEKYGRNLDAFWPVADTNIGRLGCMMAMEGNYPENGRGLAMNGAEVVYRPSMPTCFSGNDIFEISNRARALENNFYVVAPNIGPTTAKVGSNEFFDSGGGRSMIVDYHGAIIGKQFDTTENSFVAATIDVASLRYHNCNAKATNWLKDVRSELAQIIYDREIYPKNRYINSAPPSNKEYVQFIHGQIEDMIARGIYRR
jgi:predicted amidohydrolase